MKIQISNELELSPNKINGVLRAGIGESAKQYYFIQYRDGRGNPQQARVVRTESLELQLKENRIKISNL
jgi:hypothetical protein